MSIIGRQFSGVLLLFAVALIFLGVLFFDVPVATGVGMLFFSLLFIGFLFRPAVGILMILFTRVLIDQIASSYSVAITENISLNVAALFGILVIVNGCIYLLATRARALKRLPLLIPFILLLGIFIGSITYSISPLLSLQESLRVLSIFSIFVIIFDLVWRNSLRVQHILLAILFSALVPIMVALYQLLSGTGLSGTAGIDGRLFGTFAHPNAFAAFVLVIFGLLLYVTLSKNKEILRGRYWHNPTVFSLLSLFTLFILVFTFSRGGWIALLVFVSLIGLFRAPKVLLFAGILCVGLFFLSDTVHDRVEDIYNPPADSSIRWRFKQWNDVIVVWQLSPALGYGAGTEVLIHEREHGFYAGNPYTHNDLLKVLQENGAVGFAAYILLIMSAIVSLIIAYRRAPATYKLYILIVLFLFVAELIFGMSSNIWRGTAVQWILWALVASALASNVRLSEKS